MTTTSTPIPDLRAELTRATELTERLMDRLGDPDLDRPTPCTEFTLRDLLGHQVAVARRIDTVLGGGDVGDVPHVMQVPDGGHRDAFREGAGAVRRRLDDLDLHSTVTAPFGTLPAGVAVGMYVGEMTTHAWDLAATVDRSDLLDEELSTLVLETNRTRLPAEGRDELPFDEVVDPGPDASVHDRMAGWMGRNPAWRP